MANQNRNGRDVALPDENQPSWRPDDRQDRDWDSHWETERYGQGQSGYAAGRYEGDRSYGSRNQSQMGYWDQSRERGTDERFAGGRGGEAWSPMDRGERGMQGSRGDYGRSGRWDDSQHVHMSDSDRQHWSDYQQPSRSGGRGVQDQGGLYGQGGYQEGMYGRGGQQDRYGSQGYQGWGQGNQPRNTAGGFGEQGGWMGDPSTPSWTPGTSGMGYGRQREHDSSFGSHRGKGPQGYMRSDERIREMVCDCLTDDHHVDASNIEVIVKNGEVTLNGNVSDRQQKRRAEDIIEHLSGVKDVINNLRLGTSSMRSSGNGAGTSSDASAVNTSGREQAQQSGTSANDKRHRA